MHDDATNPPATGWELLGGVAPAEVTRHLAAAHRAAQLVASPGATWAPPAADHGHAALRWDVTHARLEGIAVGEDVPCRAAFDPLAGVLSVVAGERIADGLTLAGETFDGALRWLAAAFTRISPGLPAAPLAPPMHALPAHPIGDGAPFERPPAAALAELVRWFGNAARELATVATARGDASPVRLWPHHFDLAVLLQARGEHGEPARSIGVGLSPGDGSYPEPYWYVTPWPYPDVAGAPALPSGGRWHTDGFTAAVLEGSRVVAAGDATAQHEAVRAFLDAAIDASTRLLRL